MRFRAVTCFNVTDYKRQNQLKAKFVTPKKHTFIFLDLHKYVYVGKMVMSLHYETENRS